jgi:hypothetical protein
MTSGRMIRMRVSIYGDMAVLGVGLMCFGYVLGQNPELAGILMTALGGMILLYTVAFTLKIEDEKKHSRG